MSSKELLPDEVEEDSKRAYGYVAENVTYTPSVLIRDSKFDMIPTRGVLCTTGKPVLITGNCFSNITMPAIYLSGDSAEWYESGPIRNMLICENEFEEVKAEYDIQVEPVTKQTVEYCDAK